MLYIVLQLVILFAHVETGKQVVYCSVLLLLYEWKSCWGLMGDWWQALDYVIAEARQHGIRLLLSLVNNLQAYGGKSQYVKWAWQEGVGLSSSNDSFFFDPSIRTYFKNYIKVWHVYLSISLFFIFYPAPCLSSINKGL